MTFDEKIDNATHAAFEALGLRVVEHMDLAMLLNDWLTQSMNGVVTDD